MIRTQLDDIAVRRRGDADVKALLLEIKRLHGVLVSVNEIANGLGRHTEDPYELSVTDRLVALLEDEPAITKPPPPRRGKEVRPEPEQRLPHMSEREEKQLARQKRG